MVCANCAASNPDAASECWQCRTPIPGSVSQETLNDGGTPEDWSVAGGSRVPAPLADTDTLESGTVLAGRYEILQLIGRGGMGAVYKARDRELDRVVALKLIRAELARKPEILNRFKQELILARQVTHKNVIRIFDLGQSDGIKFITMEFVEGRDLRSLLLERGKLPPEQAARIMLQTCRALEAAHSEGVIHRDLKPQNVMLDPGGRVYVMDFGIARSAHLPGMTQTGALIGTPEYMSPEQARGEKLTQQSDIFSLGVIFYELLTGKSPYHSETPLATLWKRMEEKATPPSTVDPTLPQPLNNIVVKALEIEPEKRFASAGEMAHQLELWLGPSAGSSAIFLPAPKTAAYWKWASAALALLLVGAIVLFRLKSPPKPAVAHAAVTVLVADFTNKTGDSVFDETLEPPLSVALEDASFISSFNRNQARKIAAQLQPGNASLDETVARLVATREGINYLMTGTIARKDGGFAVTAKTLDAASGKSLLETTKEAPDKTGVLSTVAKLAAETRRALGDTTPESVQMSAAGTFTTSSLEAAHAYALAQDLQWAGKWEEAIPKYEQALKFDPNLGRAFAGLASTYANTGRNKEADKYYRLAMQHIDRMSDREKYRTRGGYYLANREPRKAMEEYKALVQQFPSDAAGYSNLALAYFYLRDMAAAVEQGRHAVDLAPKGLIQLNNLALYSVYAGDFSAAADDARKVLAQNPSFALAHNTLAMAQAGQGQLAESESTYQKLEAISGLGAEMAVKGRADLLLYRGRSKEAVALLAKASNPSNGKLDEVTLAAYLLLTAEAKLASGKGAEAAADAKAALARDAGDTNKFSAGRIYVEAGQSAAALAIASNLAKNLDAESQGHAKLLEGEVSLKRGETKKAIVAFSEAQKLSDTWLGRLDLGRAYVAAGAFTEADSELENCVRRRGEASAVFLDDVPTFRMFPAVYYYLGRAQEGLGSSGAADSFRKFVSIQEGGDGGPLLADAQKRLAKLAPARR